MPKNSFVMYVQKQGRIKYLLLTMVPPIALTYLFSLILDFGIKLDSEVVGLMPIFLTMAIMMILGYFLISEIIIEVRLKTIRLLKLIGDSTKYAELRYPRFIQLSGIF